MDFTENLQELCDKCCMEVLAGVGTGSVIHLKFDHFDSSIMIYSSWTLQQGQRIICDSSDPNENNGPMVQGLRLLVGKQIISLNTLPEHHDLSITFENDFRLKVACDGYLIDEDYDNYTVYFPTESFTVQADFSIYQTTL